MSGDDDQTHLRIRIEGQVQAVGYRDFVLREARARTLDGWVRNRTDGTVEVLASGPTKAVEALIQACIKGPPGARVANFELHKAEPAEEKGFRRRPSL